MTHLRTVRLPATVPAETVSTSGGTKSIQVAQDGTITVRFDGVLVVAGRQIPSPGQLLQVWHGTGGMEFDLLNEQLDGDDEAPQDEMARMAAYGVGLNMVRQCREKGLTDAQVAQVLRGVRDQTYADARRMPAQQRAGMEKTTRIMAGMIDDWERTLEYTWSDDDA